MTRHSRIFLFLACLSMAVLPSCARQELKREMKRFMASEIVLPEVEEVFVGRYKENHIWE